MKIPRVVLAGTNSGVGKTSITASIIHGMREKGYSVQPFKAGPDFIDPSYLSAVAKRDAHNLDPWLMGTRGVLREFVQNSTSDMSIIEGVMGYYDGFSGDSNFASTYHIARTIKAPVILVLDASRTARSIAATAMGFVKFQRRSGIAGLILNKIGSRRHEELCRQALDTLHIPVVGCIYRDAGIELESRHLGLVPVREERLLEKKIRSVAKLYSEYIDVDKIVQICRNAPALPEIPMVHEKKTRAKIAVALDESFNFYYRANLDSLRREGAVLKFFSPVHDKKIPACDGLYIGGGFPEVKADLLEKNGSMKKEIGRVIVQGMPVYAECGGLMYLTRSIIYGDRKFGMVGVYDTETVMQKKLKLNYTKAKVSKKCPVSAPGHLLKGHEFHFSELQSISRDSRFAYEMDIGVGIDKGRDGIVQYNALASYMHMHFAQPSVARNFVESCSVLSRR